MRYGSVCSGIEAATVAWHSLGWEPVFFSEIEPFPSAVLKHHYPEVPNWGDMTKYKEWPDATIDVLVGGTPCQSFSVAGLRKGLDDPRGNLMLTYLAIALKYRPKWVVWENVPGVLSSNGGRDFATFFRGLEECGYGVAYRVFDSQYVRTCEFPRAVPQRRRRVFVVGCLGSWQRAAAVLFERDSLCGNPPPRREKREAAAASTAIGLDAEHNADIEKVGAIRSHQSGGWDGCKVMCYENHPQDSRIKVTEVPTINAKAGTGGGNLPLIMQTGQANTEITEDICGTLNCNHEAPIVCK